MRGVASQTFVSHYHSAGILPTGLTFLKKPCTLFPVPILIIYWNKCIQIPASDTWVFPLNDHFDRLTDQIQHRAEWGGYTLVQWNARSRSAVHGWSEGALHYFPGGVQVDEDLVVMFCQAFWTQLNWCELCGCISHQMLYSLSIHRCFPNIIRKHSINVQCLCRWYPIIQVYYTLLL